MGHCDRGPRGGTQMPLGMSPALTGAVGTKRGRHVRCFSCLAQKSHLQRSCCVCVPEPGWPLRAAGGLLGGLAVLLGRALHEHGSTVSPDLQPAGRSPPLWLALPEVLPLSPDHQSWGWEDRMRERATCCIRKFQNRLWLCFPLLGSVP